MELADILKLEMRLPLNLIEIDNKLLEDIKENGIQEPVEIRIRKDGSKIVWDGLHRLKIAVMLDIKDVPVIYAPM